MNNRWELDNRDSTLDFSEVSDPLSPRKGKGTKRTKIMSQMNEKNITKTVRTQNTTSGNRQRVQMCNDIYEGERDFGRLIVCDYAVFLFFEIV